MAEGEKQERDNSRGITPPEFLEKGRQEYSESHRKSILSEGYDGFSYAVEGIRSLFFDRIISFTQSLVQVGRNVFYPKNEVEEKLKKISHSERKGVKHSLLMSRLSLYDTFSADGGVPGYWFSKPFTSVEGEASSRDWTPLQKDENSASSSRKQPSPFQGKSEEDGSMVSVCAFSEDGARFVICYESGEVIVWDADHGDMVDQTKDVLGSRILAVSFAQHSESIVQLVTRDYKYWKRDLSNKLIEKGNMSAYWRDIERGDGQVELHTADFLNNGKILVCSSIFDSRFAYGLELVVADTAFFPKCQLATKLNISVTRGSVVSGVEVSPNGKGLIVGTFLSSMKTGVCYLWPSFKENSASCKELPKGTLGSWSSNSDLVVTWTVPDGPKPEENDGSSAFLWNVNELRKKLPLRDVNFTPIVLKSPFGEKVLWCRLVLNMEGADRLIMTLIGTTTKFLFWDVGSKSHTHTIETGILTKDMPLASTKAWENSRVEKKTVKGLSPMAVTTDRSKFGAVLGRPSQVLIYDAMLGIQSLKLTLQLSVANKFAGGADIMFSPTNGKIAMVGQHSAMLFAPSTPSRNSQSNGGIIQTPMIELDNHQTNSAEGAEYKLLFSGDGNTLGLLSIGYSEMQVYHLVEGTTCTIKMDPQMQDGILDFCFSLDGQYLVTSTSKKAMHVWKCTKKEGELKASVRDTDGTIALGITPDAKQIIVCSPESDLCWYTSSTNNGSESGQSLNTVSRGTGSESHVSVGGDVPREHGEEDVHTPLLSRHHRLCHASTICSTRGTVRKEPNSIYKCTHRMHGSAVIGCRISANCEKAAVVRKQGQLEVWNLKDMTLARTVPFGVSNISTTISQDLIPLSGVGIPRKRTRARTLSCDSFDQFRSDPETTVLPEKEGFHLTNSIDSSPASLLQQTHADCSTALEESLNEDLSSIYIVNHDVRKHSRQLNGRSLDPKSGLAMSADGRHVACLAGKFASKIVVWSACASQELLPDYHSLSLLYDIKNKSVVERETKKLLGSFGSNFFTFQPPSGLTVLLDAVSSLNKPFLCSILKYGLEHHVKVSLLIPKKTNDQSLLAGYANAVEASLMRRSPEIVKVTMNALLERVTHEAELSSILSRSLIHLQNKYPEIFETVIEGSHLFKEVCKIEVSENLFDHDEFLPITSACLSLTECEMKKASELALEETKECKVKEARKSESKPANDADSVTLTASALAFPFYNACQFGRYGLSRYLLLDGARHTVFGSFAIRAIVDFKWRTYAKKLLLQELLHHCLVAVAFTVYCFFLHDEETFEIADTTGDEENSDALKSTLAVCWILALPCLIRELNQCMVYSTRHQWTGFVYWLKSGWNWMEVLSYFNIVVVIPLGHFVLANKGHGTIGLSVMAATESLLLWSRMLFYARPFRPTGPFVIVISSLASTIMPFLLLAFCVMFGFALAFHILYRHVSEITSEQSEDDDSSYVSMHGSFHTLENTMFTTFGFLFGQFEADDVYDAPYEPAATFLFSLYMVTMSIILLSMLIALMGEKFEKIQNSKESRFIEAIAKAVDDVDSMLSRRRKRDKIGTFLHVIVPSFTRKRIVNNLRAYDSAERRSEVLDPKTYHALKTASSKIVSEVLAGDSFRTRTSTLHGPLSRINEDSQHFRTPQVAADASSDKSVHEKLDADSETRYE